MSPSEAEDGARDDRPDGAPPGALVVTGGGRGIGSRVAVRAAQAGLDVAILYLEREDAARSTLREIEAAGARGLAIRADVAVEDDIVRAFAQVDRELVLGALLDRREAVAFLVEQSGSKTLIAPRAVTFKRIKSYRFISRNSFFKSFVYCVQFF